MLTKTLNKERNKKQYDKHTISLPELAIGETVRLQPDFPHQQWRIAKCLQKVGPRSYLVQTEEGRKYRRNCKYLRTTTEDFKEQDSSIVEPEITAASNKQDFNASSKSQQPESHKSPQVESHKSPKAASRKSSQAEKQRSTQLENLIITRQQTRQLLHQKHLINQQHQQSNLQSKPEVAEQYSNLPNSKTM